MAVARALILTLWRLEQADGWDAEATTARSRSPNVK